MRLRHGGHSVYISNDIVAYKHTAMINTNNKRRKTQVKNFFLFVSIIMYFLDPGRKRKVLNERFLRKDYPSNFVKKLKKQKYD